MPARCSSGKTINIPYAYADLRFNPAFDKKSGFFTRSILCVPVINKEGRIIGVTQVLNKRGGPFTAEDEARLKAFTAQVSIALENAKLFADVQAMKNYNEAMLESMSNGLITLDESEKVATCNAAGLRILKAAAQEILHKPVAEFFCRNQCLGGGKTQAGGRDRRAAGLWIRLISKIYALPSGFSTSPAPAGPLLKHDTFLFL